MGRPKGSKNKNNQTKTVAKATGPAEEPESVGSVSANASMKKRKYKKSRGVVAFKKPGKNEFKKAKVYHSLKREVLAPFLAELYIKLHWKHLISDLRSEVTVLSRLDEDDVSDADNTSYQEDWRSENDDEGSSS